MAFISSISNFFLNAVAITQPTGVWEKIIMAFHNGIPNYAWAIIVFTIVLKVALLPLDFLNKKITVKNQKVQAIIQPEIAKVQKQYGNNKQILNQKTMEIYKKYNYNVTGSCLIMLVNMGLTLFIFITLFAGLNSMAAYKVGYQYQEMEKTYNEYVVTTNYDDYLSEYETAYDTQYDTYGITDDSTAEEKTVAVEGATAAAETATASYDVDAMLEEINNAVVDTYNNVKNSWLWIDNVWKSDVPWKTSATSFDEFVGSTRITYKDALAEGEGTFYVRLSADKDSDREKYENVVAAIESEEGVNGYLIIPILSVLATLFSILATQGKLKFWEIWTKKGKEKRLNMPEQPKQPGGGILMMILLPALMGYITLSYNAVFGLYILMSSLVGIATTPLINLFIKKIDKHNENKPKKDKVEVSYKR